ncbi:hypothetical protein HOA87_08445 [bacterium]|nr:hypothetical protein [bacterium]MBT6777994.1 hypothetical protein [bacterium]
MEKVNQSIIYRNRGSDLDCEVVREHSIFQWDKKEFESFKSCVDDALNSHKMPEGLDAPKIEDIIFKPPNKPIEDISNPVRKVLVTKQKVDKNLNVIKVFEKYTVEEGSKFHCLEKKENCTITGFQPYDYDNNEELDVNVQYDSGEKGISYIDSLRSI